MHLALIKNTRDARTSEANFPVNVFLKNFERFSVECEKDLGIKLTVIQIGDPHKLN